MPISGMETDPAWLGPVVESSLQKLPFEPSFQDTQVARSGSIPVEQAGEELIREGSRGLKSPLSEG